MDVVLGLDIGGTGIKAAPVDLATGEFAGERYRLKTPQPATPAAVVETAAKVIRHFEWKGPVGCGFPAVIRDGNVGSAVNIDPTWIDQHAVKLLEQATGLPVAMANDADVAAMAEVRFGAAAGKSGTVIVATLGTGIGTGILIDGKLFPNTELGTLYLPDGKMGEKYASERARKEGDLSWKEWGKRLSVYFRELERLTTPDLFVLGGGGAKKFDKFAEYLDIRTPFIPATLGNHAGIVGAALLAAERFGK